MNDERYMQTAIALAKNGLGRTWPNPSVACVIVKNGEIIAQSRTANSGRPHAETLALDAAGADAQGATVYVTLEPCAHQGKTGPCANALIAAKVAEVVIGCIDPNPIVSGKGIKMLQKADIKVTTSILEKECMEVNKGFFKVIDKSLPYVMLKAAISADGRYYLGTGTPRWVTGEIARREVQYLRSQYDAILTGTGTILADNPHLNCRLPGLEDCSPLKVIIGNRRIPGSANIFKGKEVWLYDDSPQNVLKDLAKRGITRVMVETGPKLSNTMLASKLADEVLVFQSAQKIGAEGEEFFNPRVFNNYQKLDEKSFGDDKMASYKLIA